MGHDLVSIVDGEDVAVAQIKAAGGDREKEGVCEAKSWVFNTPWLHFFFQVTHFFETYYVSGPRLGR